MAAVQQTSGSKLVFKLGDGGSPEVFNTLCTINAQRGMTFNKGMNDEETIDCNDPEAIAWAVRTAISKSVAVTGAGKLHKPDVKKAWDWWNSAEAVNGKMILDDPDADNVITWSGKFHLTDFEVSGDRRTKVDCSLTIASEGEITAVFGANVGGA